MTDLDEFSEYINGFGETEDRWCDDCEDYEPTLDDYCLVCGCST